MRTGGVLVLNLFDPLYDLLLPGEHTGLILSRVVTHPISRSEWKESSDRFLNRAYGKPHGLLAPAEQKELADEERAWIVKRDAIKTVTEKNEFIRDATSCSAAPTKSLTRKREDSAHESRFRPAQGPSKTCYIVTVNPECLHPKRLF
jgi:hypothetical protein